MRENQNVFSRIELPVLFLYLALTLIGWLSIYAAVFNEDHTSIFDITQRYGKQLLWIGLALLLGLIVLLTDSRFFNGYACCSTGIWLNCFGKQVVVSNWWLWFATG